MPPAAQATGGQGWFPGKSHGMSHTGPAARACHPEAHWRGGSPVPPAVRGARLLRPALAAVDRPYGGGQFSESRGGGAQGAVG